MSKVCGARESFFPEHPDDGRNVAAQFFADGLEVLLKSSSMRMANVAITSPLGFGHCRTVGKMAMPSAAFRCAAPGYSLRETGLKSIVGNVGQSIGYCQNDCPALKINLLRIEVGRSGLGACHGCRRFEFHGF